MTASPNPPVHGNVNAAEIGKFDRLAARWWDPDGESRPLHDLNPARLGYVAAQRELKGARVADIGCGGGLLSEAMARAGAEVTAIDMAAEVVEVARMHLYESGLEVDYRRCAAETLAAEQPASFDLVTCMEMLEHVPDPAAVIGACATLLKPGGRLVVSTLNRTPQAFGLAILGAEYVLRLLPRGTHRYGNFIRPAELAGWMRAAGLEPLDVSGLHYNPFSRRAWVGAGTGVNYLACAARPE
jgi:2-polyprenyl-6-hydroxyphenyl methylase / 3-demethylubiquinone-9 3-methyltransferase